MYAPKLRDMTKDERWAEGFAYRIDAKADAFLAEVRAMASKAMEDLGLNAKTPEDVDIDSLTYFQNCYVRNSVPNALQDLMMQGRAAQNVYPAGAYNSGLIGSLGNILGNPFGQSLGRNWNY